MDELIERAKLVKARWSMESLITALTGDIVPQNRKITSMFNPDENTPSMHVYDDHFHDFSTGKSGDVIELIQIVKHCNFATAIEYLEEEADVERLPIRVHIEKRKDVFQMPDLLYYDGHMRTVIPSPKGVNLDTWDWMFEKGILGVRRDDSAVAVIHYDAETGRPNGVKYRHPDGLKTAEPGSEFSKSLYWVKSEPMAKSCVILEGESDLWAWMGWADECPQLFALPCGAGTWRDEWLKTLERFDHIWICMDNDAAGLRARDKIALKVGYGRAEFVKLPQLYNDVRAAIIEDWVPPNIGY